MPSYFIAGIDPGATVGIAIVSLGGRKLATFSTSDGMAGAAKIIERHGTPSLIACDVYPAPEMAQKLASYFSCRLYCPQKEIREEEKRRIAGEAGRAIGGSQDKRAEISNNHERDAYAAAIYGYRLYANKLRQIDSLADLSSEEKEKLKHLLLKGYRIVDAFAALREPEGIAKDDGKKPETTLLSRTLSSDELRARVSALARENANLRIALERQDDEKRQLMGKLALLENGVRQNFLHDSELRKLRFRLQQSLERIRPKGKIEKRQQPREMKLSIPQKARETPAESPKQPLEVQAEGDGLYNFEERIDLEKLVAEYRRGRKESA